ncbi:glycosyltransferase involved in cell wall biosynthesis [Glaciihabitans tibetensis]|uniref:D-inositol 3-phosphate glycosyltransferase n=1 Tax=Glaciihabitans tibetensis TaxID=1266600 RepID=A0A2T0VAS6_9MICO|nr:glycosyltransferase [Glaciihabitans tibetensis]PRY67292.1 glycosyltransferase involved in cell wall biosynthesis [Glaciihabitans tibetensis]
MGIQTSLDELRATEHIVEAMRAADELAFVASRDAGARTVRVLAGALSGPDQITAIAAVHALAQVFDEEADAVLSALLSSNRAYLREHAAWAFGARLPRFDTIGRLVGSVIAGSFSGMLAQRTLGQWATSAPDHVAVGLETALLGVRETDSRYRLTETLSLVPGSIATTVLSRIAADALEPERVRAAAVAGLGERTGIRSVLELVRELATVEGYLGDVARLALVDLTTEATPRAPWQTGLTVAQLFLHADIDPELTRAGSGDNGGIATLLVRLGDALTAEAPAHPDDPTAAFPVQRVLTLSRGSAEGALDSLSQVGSTVQGHSYAAVPLLSDPVPSPDAWPLRVAAERGIRRILRAAGTVDVLHLRMADVGSLAASNVARELGIPVVFTVAPDPHAVINSLELSGALTRENFGDIDAREHYWFRARLVQRLAGDAAHTVLFPRPALQRDMKELVGIDITSHPERHSIVPEGIDLAVVDLAVAETVATVAGAEPTEPLRQLQGLLAELPPERRGLPLLLSVGRMHRVKGMAAIVEAWATSPLRHRANLLIVGGNLSSPSADEREQLDRIEALVPATQQHNAGLLLAGHQPNDTVARWVAATRFGIAGFAGPGGVYVCGSVKEEFGIALLEAMAAGLMVVAPEGGGPATYVREGGTGYLVRTSDVGLLATAIGAALDAVATETGPERADEARATVADHFTIEAMAFALSSVYAGVGAAESELARLERDNWTVTAR